jgi:transcription initiation factor TFIIIB Brf1 subunit/transcription initiation factor TFIIB
MKPESVIPLACKSEREQRTLKETQTRIQEIRKEVQKDSRLLSRYCLVDGGVLKK